MSLLDTIKSIFCGEKPKDSAITEKVEDIKEKVEEVVEDLKDKAEEVFEDIKETIEEAVDTVEEKIEEVVAVDTPPVVKSESTTKDNTAIQLPEDSALRRHAISALKMEIESTMPARPTDSTLKRHYDATVQAKLAELIG